MSTPALKDTLDLTGAWQFLPDPIAEGERSKYFDPQVDVSSWHTAIVPATFESTLQSLAGYEGAAWYRRDVHVPDNWHGRRVVISYAGANYRTVVWINGIEVGRNDDGFLPFAFAVHDQLKFGETNTIAVRVDNTRRVEDVPGKQRGWKPRGGILREVSLQATSHERIDTVCITAEPHAGGGNIDAVVKLAIDEKTSVESTLTLTIREEEKILAKFEAIAAAEVHFNGHIDGALPWSPHYPQLYIATLELQRAGVLIDRHEMRIGFRSIATQSTQLLLNDKPIFLYGFNRHEDSPQTDFCPDHELTRQDLLSMKEMGCNFVRLAHYPHHPRTLEMCDEMGLLVMAEIPLYWWQGKREGDENLLLKKQAAQRQLERMIERDFNHPSIIMWGVSNETSEELPEVVAGNSELVRHCKTLDPTRLATHVSNRWPEHPHFEDDDVISLNGYPTYEALSEGTAQSSTKGSGGDWWREHLEKLHVLYPDKPIFISEFGYPAIDGVIEGSHGEKAQADAIKQEYSAFDVPYICGTAIWCYADHPWPEGLFINGIAISPYGVVSRNRRKKLGFSVVQQLFTRRSDSTL